MDGWGLMVGLCVGLMCGWMGFIGGGVCGFDVGGGLTADTAGFC